MSSVSTADFSLCPLPGVGHDSNVCYHSFWKWMSRSITRRPLATYPNCPRRPPQPSFPAPAFHPSSNRRALCVHCGGPGLVLASGCGAVPSWTPRSRSQQLVQPGPPCRDGRKKLQRFISTSEPWPGHHQPAQHLLLPCTTLRGLNDSRKLLAAVFSLEVTMQEKFWGPAMLLLARALGVRISQKLHVNWRSHLQCWEVLIGPK